MALLPWQTGTVAKIEKETATTWRFRIKVEGTAAFDFKPGQFVTLDLPIDEKPARRLRSYSISSWPDGTDGFELLIALNKEGAGTPYIFEHIGVGDKIKFRGPQGVFTLPEKLDKDLFLICTGTGIAPFRSMVQFIHHRKLEHKNVYLVFGSRTRHDLLYYDELTALQKKMKNFCYLPTLSREEWEGRHGYVHSVYEELCKGKQDALFFLCGWKDMIDEAQKKILDMGYDKKVIRQELYG